jgi:hypothetical protein
VAHSDAACRETVDDTAAGLAGRAKDENWLI